MAAQYPAFLEQQSDELAAALALRTLQSVASDEVPIGRFEGHRPGESRLEGMKVLVHVVAVQIHAGFQPERIPRAQAGGLHALRPQSGPRARGARRGDHDFETILAGVAGPGDEPRSERRTEEGFQLEDGKLLRRSE